MNSLNNNNVILNGSQQQPPAAMAANTSSTNNGGSATTTTSGFAKGLSLFASIGHSCSNQTNNAGQALNNIHNNNTPNSHLQQSNNNSIYNNNQSEAAAGVGQLSDNMVLSGNLRKLKTMKKKFFVLYRNAPNRPARLEYFDSEKKYRLHASHPKRSIRLEACFNINRRTDTKHKCVIALYTNEDCFCIVCDNEQELELWLHKMLSLQNNKDENGEPPKPAFGEY